MAPRARTPAATLSEHQAKVLAETAMGAYGLRISGIAEAQTMLVPSGRDWPHLRIVASLENPDARPELVTDLRADLSLKTGGRLTIDRDTGVARFAVPRRLTDHELVHPFLAPAAAVMAHWSSRPCFHGGAFVSNEGVWALIGDREGGKSSTLAWLVLHGHAVVADDVLVLSGGTAFAGPRSIDLRQGAAEYLGAGEALGVVGARPRWRLPLPPFHCDLPLRGWVFLAWDGRVEVEALPASQCLARLLQHRCLRVTPSDPASFLELASLPAWELRRPRDWWYLDEAGERLLEVTSPT